MGRIGDDAEARDGILGFEVKIWVRALMMRCYMLDELLFLTSSWEKAPKNPYLGL